MKKIYKNWRGPLVGDQWSSGNELIIKKEGETIYYKGRMKSVVTKLHLSKRFRDR
tara:strand:- start:1468 stop:1632 length:165 start_codon:yes stop_codon:yes gene_type:complete